MLLHSLSCTLGTLCTSQVLYVHSIPLSNYLAALAVYSFVLSPYNVCQIGSQATVYLQLEMVCCQSVDALNSKTPLLYPVELVELWCKLNIST